jgi:hypothetical protein
VELVVLEFRVGLGQLEQLTLVTVVAVAVQVQLEMVALVVRVS